MSGDSIGDIGGRERGCSIRDIEDRERGVVLSLENWSSPENFGPAMD